MTTFILIAWPSTLVATFIFGIFFGRKNTKKVEAVASAAKVISTK